MTRIEIEHRGWERLGSAADQWRDQNRAGWQTLLPHFQAIIAKGNSSHGNDQDRPVPDQPAARRRERAPDP
jgi:hypothetical protein